MSTKAKKGKALKPRPKSLAAHGRSSLAHGSAGSPITRKIMRLSDGSMVGWSLYAEEYERAIEAIAGIGIAGDIYGADVARKMWRKLMPATQECWRRSARKYLAAIGITPPNPKLTDPKDSV